MRTRANRRPRHRWKIAPILLIGLTSGLVGRVEGETPLREELAIRLAGEAVDQRHGTVVCTIPDLDLDGIDDLAVAAPLDSPGGLANAGFVQWVSSRTGIELGRATGEIAGMELGTAIVGAGDLDGDGFGDLVVGAPGFPERGELDHGAVIALSGATSEILWTVSERGGTDRLGTGVVALEDFDGDGVAEILACGPGVGNRRGRFYLISGADGTVRQKARLGDHGEETGAALALAEDLDGDGNREILIGAPAVDNGKGRVYVISRRRTPLLILDGDTAGGRFGAALCGAQDRDGDGVPDLVIGAPGGSSVPGRVHLLSGVDGAEILALPGTAGESFGTSLCASRDVDGDGWRDIAVGAPGTVASSGEVAGAVFVYSGQDSSLLFHLEGKTPGSRTGESLTLVPDLDGDGGGELLVGSPGASPFCVSSSGSAELLALKDRSPILFHLAADSFNPLGTSVHSAGDVDGDQIPDFIVGVPLEDPDQRRNAGSVFVFSGRDGQPLRRLDGERADDEFGTAVSSLGDINGDGLSDVIIGAPGPEGLAPRAGAMYAYSVMNGQLLYRIDGTQDGDRFGSALSTSMDFDGDGYNDVLVGSPGADPEGVIDAGNVEVFSGATGIFLGGIPGSNLGDRFGSAVDWVGSLDGDGIPDILVGAPYASPGGRLQTGLLFVIAGSDWRNLRVFSGSSFFDHFGSSVAGLADLDGDSVPEFTAGAPDANPRGLPDAGSVRVFSGATGIVLHTLDGAERGDRAGSSVASAGDANGDGVPDYLVGMSGALGNGLSGAGQAHLVSGLDGSILLTHEGDDIGLAMGHSVSSAGDVDADGFPEIIVGGSGLGIGGNGGRLTVIDVTVAPSIRCRVGTVNRGAGLPTDVLRINGSVGATARRIVSLAVGEGFDIVLESAPLSRSSQPPAAYAAYLWDGEPDDASVTPLPFALGEAAFPLPMTGGPLQPFRIVNRFGTDCFGVQSFEEDGQGALVFSMPDGFSQPRTVTVQAVLPDPGSGSPEGLSLSNAVVLVVE